MQRRDFLALAGSAFPIALMAEAPGSARAVGSSVESLEHRLAAYALAVRFEDLPPEAVSSAKRIVLDTLACALAAVGSEAAVIAEKTVRESFGPGSNATVFGSAKRATIEGAVLVNGILVRSLDLNDTYLGTEPLHPSELLPIALAIGEDRRCSGQDFIAALVTGYEASARITDVISFMQRGFHPLCSMSYAAPLVAGRLWGLKATEIANAVGLSAARGYTSFVVNSGSISMMKAMGFAASALDAILVTRLAANGFTGPTGTLEWFAARANTPQASIEVDLEPTRMRLLKVALKRFPIQIELAAVAEAGIKLSSRLRGRASDIRAIRVETYPGIIERVADASKFRPETRGTADHSLPVCLAMALLDGDVSLAQFEKDRWREGDVIRLVQQTTVSPSTALMAKFPNGRGAVVEVQMQDGASIRETVEVPEGDARRPLSLASLQAKFMSAAIPVLGAAGSERVLAQVGALDRLPDIRDLARALAKPG